MNDQEEEKSASQQIAEGAKRKATNVARKAVSNLAKKAAKQLVSLVIKVVVQVVSYVAALLAPYILVIVGVLFGLVLIYIATTMLFSIDSNDMEDDYSKELISYIEEQSNKSIDSSKPEQAPYRVPPDLIVATMQIHNSQDFGKKEKEIIKEVVKALTPTFTYIEKDIKVQTKKYTCVQIGDGEQHCADEKTDKIETVKVLSEVDAWDRKVSFTYKKKEGSWENSEENSETVGKDENRTVTTEGTSQKTDSFESEENTTPDYGYFDSTLREDPLNYGDKDLKMVEVLYLTTGAEMYYTEWLKGETFELSSYDIGYSDVNVEPGKGIPAEFMPHYLAVQKKYGIPWYYMASIHYQETRFGTNLAESSAGAVGHTQFMKCTWIGWAAPGCSTASKATLLDKSIIARYGGYGSDEDGDGKADPWSVADSMGAAGKYLKALKFSDSNAKSVRESLASYGGVKAYWYADEVTARAKKYKEQASYNDGTHMNSIIKVTGASDSPMMPLKNYKVTSSFGKRILNGQVDIHRAMDLSAPTGEAIMAITDGEVVRSNNNCSVGLHSCGMGWGNFVWTKQIINGQTYEVVYAHMNSAIATSGKLKKGQIIGTVGNTGHSFGSHLHIEIHKGIRVQYQNAVNPALILPY